MLVIFRLLLCSHLFKPPLLSSYPGPQLHSLAQTPQPCQNLAHRCLTHMDYLVPYTLKSSFVTSLQPNPPLALGPRLPQTPPALPLIPLTQPEPWQHHLQPQWFSGTGETQGLLFWLRTEPSGSEWVR